MKIKEFMIETFQNISINGILYSLNSDEKRIYTEIKNASKLLKSDLSEFDQRIANNLVTRGLIQRRKTPQHEIYFVAKGRRKSPIKQSMDEVAPPDSQIEKWINDNKQRFQDRYGKNYKKYLYGKAWNKFNGKKLTEGYVKRKTNFGNTGFMIDDDYIDFEIGMSYIDDNDIKWTITNIKIDRDGDKICIVRSEDGQYNQISEDILNTNIFALEDYKMVYDERFFDKNDGM